MDTEERMMDAALFCGLIITIIVTVLVVWHTLIAGLKQIRMENGGPKNRSTIHRQIYGS